MQKALRSKATVAGAIGMGRSSVGRLAAGLGILLALAGIGGGRMQAEPVQELEVFPGHLLLRVDAKEAAQRRRTWDEQHLLAALQGLVNRDRPRLYTLLVGREGATDRYWLEKLRAPGGWLASARLRERTNLLDLVQQHRSRIRGVVVWDERVPATALVASTACGVEDLLPVRYDPQPGSWYHRLVEEPGGPRLPVRRRLLRDDGAPMFTGERTGSAKCDAVLWAVEEFLRPGQCDPTVLAYYPDAWWLHGKTDVPPERTLLCNHDYFISRRAFFFDLGPWEDEAPNDDPGQPPGTDGRTLRRLLAVAQAQAKGRMIHVGGFTPWDQKYTDHTGGRRGGVPTEWHYAEILSSFDAYLDADAPGLHAMANASVFRHFPLADRYVQRPVPTEGDLRARGYLDASGRVVAKRYAAIYAGDYDAAAWLYQKLPEVWEDPARGTVPLGWAFNPALMHRFPVGLVLARATATTNDVFIAGDSGYGYLNPGGLVPPRRWSGLPSGLEPWERLCAEGYRRWDLRVTGFVIDGDAPAMSEEVRLAYARFSPGGVVAQKIPSRSLVAGVPFLRMGDDLADPEQGRAAILRRFPASSPGPDFGIFRTILWTPGQHRRMFEAVRGGRPDIEFVDPHVLFELLRRHLEREEKAE